MRIDTLAATSISLSWSVPFFSEVTSHEVMWQRDTTGECFDEDGGSVTITDTSYDITGLEEDSSYIITVRAVDASITSDVTGTAITLEAGEREMSLIISRMSYCKVLYNSSSVSCSFFSGSAHI